MTTTPAVPHAVDPAVSRIDLSSVRDHLTRSPLAIMSADEWPAAELEYRRFLTLRNRFPGQLLIPSGTTLSIWQAHILDTRAYRTDCEVAFGRYLDHFPYLGDSHPADQAEREIGLRNLRQLTHHHHCRSASTGASSELSQCDSNSISSNLSPVERVIVLVSLPWRQEGHQTIPLGHATILARLKADPQLDVRSIVRPINAAGFSAPLVADEILKLVGITPHQKADVAIGAYVWNDSLVREIVRLVRDGGFRGRIILGGPQVTYAGKGLEALYPEVDAFIRGAGEDALYALARIENSLPIPGVHRAGTPDCIVQASTNLEALPSPWLSGVLDASASTSVHWESQRGCPYVCSFCQHRQRDPRETITKLNANRVTKEIALLCDSGVNRISVLDPVFNLDEVHAATILNQFIDNEFKGEISLQCRAELVNLGNPVFLNAAERLNVILEFGLQSVVEAEFRAVRRPNKVQKISAVLQEVQRRGIRHEVSLIYGLPEQTLESFVASVNWCLERNIPVVRAFPLLLLRGTELHERSVNWQLVVRDFVLPTVISSSTFAETEWQAMDEVARALAWAADNAIRFASVDRLLEEYRQSTVPSVGLQLCALGRIQ